MIYYGDTDYQLRVIFMRSGSVLPQVFTWAFTNAVMAVFLHWLQRSGLVTWSPWLDMSGTQTIWSGYTAVLGFLVVFRNNQAYSRFWEGATLVNQTRGEWMNAVSSLMAFCNTNPEMMRQVDHFQHLMIRLASLLHCAALQEVCEIEDANLEILDCSGLDVDSLMFLEQVHDRCEIIMSWIQRLIMKAHMANVVVAPPPILSRSFQELSRGVVNLNNVRKIRDVPFPFPYTQVLIFMLSVHWVITSMLAASVVDSMAWAGIICFFVTGALWSVIYIGKEIDQPFGEDPNDLPMVAMQKDFNRSLINLMHPRAKVIPTYNHEGHRKKVSVTARYSFQEREEARLTEMRKSTAVADGRKSMVQGRRSIRWDEGEAVEDEEVLEEKWDQDKINLQRQITPSSNASSVSLKPVPKIDETGRRNLNRASGYAKAPVAPIESPADEPKQANESVHTGLSLSADVDMLSCQHCGEDLKPSWCYCMNCGHSRPRCVSCHTSLPPPAHFCPDCGYKVDEAEETSNVDSESETPILPHKTFPGLQETLFVTSSVLPREDRAFVDDQAPNTRTLLEVFDSARGARQVAEFVI